MAKRRIVRRTTHPTHSRFRRSAVADQRCAGCAGRISGRCGGRLCRFRLEVLAGLGGDTAGDRRGDARRPASRQPPHQASDAILADHRYRRAHCVVRGDGAYSHLWSLVGQTHPNSPTWWKSRRLKWRRLISPPSRKRRLNSASRKRPICPSPPSERKAPQQTDPEKRCPRRQCRWKAWRSIRASSPPTNGGWKTSNRLRGKATRRRYSRGKPRLRSRKSRWRSRRPISRGLLPSGRGEKVDAADLVRKRTDEGLTFKRSVDLAPVDEKFSEQPRLARKQDDLGDPLDSTAAAALPRRLNNPPSRQTPRSKSTRPPAASRETQPDAVAPANTIATRQSTTSPISEPRPTPPTSDAAATVGGDAARALAAPEQPQLAQAERPASSARHGQRLAPTRRRTQWLKRLNRIQRRRMPIAASSRATSGGKSSATSEPQRRRAVPAEAEPETVAASAARAFQSAETPAISPAVAPLQVRQVARPPATQWLRIPLPKASPSSRSHRRREAQPAESKQCVERYRSRRRGGRGARVEAEAGATGIAANAGPRLARLRFAQWRRATPLGRPRFAPRGGGNGSLGNECRQPGACPSVAGIGPAGRRPFGLALSKGNGGVAGGGRSPNADRAMAAGESPALVASGAAQRAEASQAQPEGAALAPAPGPHSPRGGRRRPALGGNPRHGRSGRRFWLTASRFHRRQRQRRRQRSP